MGIPPAFTGFLARTCLGSISRIYRQATQEVQRWTVTVGLFCLKRGFFGGFLLGFCGFCSGFMEEECRSSSSSQRGGQEGQEDWEEGPPVTKRVRGKGGAETSAAASQLPDAEQPAGGEKSAFCENMGGHNLLSSRELSKWNWPTWRTQCMSSACLREDPLYLRWKTCARNKWE